MAQAVPNDEDAFFAGCSGDISRKGPAAALGRAVAVAVGHILGADALQRTSVPLGTDGDLLIGPSLGRGFSRPFKARSGAALGFGFVLPPIPQPVVYADHLQPLRIGRIPLE